MIDIQDGPLIRFVLDNNVDVKRTGNFIQGAGGSVIQLPPRLRKATDRTVFDYAKQVDRMLITHDAGFLDFEEFPPEENPGIIVIPGGSGDIDDYMDDIGPLLGFLALTFDLAKGAYVHLHADHTFVVHTFQSDEDKMGTDYMRINDEGDVEIWVDDE